MALAFVGTPTSGSANGSGPVSTSIPTGWQEDDYAIIGVCSTNFSAQTISLNQSWEQKGDRAIGGNWVRGAVWAKRLGSSETAPTITLGGSTDWRWGMVVLRDVDGTTPIQDIDSAVDESFSTTQPTFPTLDADGNTVFSLVFLNSEGTGGSPDYGGGSWPAGWASILDIPASDGASGKFCIATNESPGTGSIGGGAITQPQGKADVLWHLLVREAGGGPVEVTPGVASLTTTRQTPTVAATANQNVSPGIIALTTARQTPTVATPTVVTPGIVALTTARQTPTVAATANVNLTPGIIALVTANQTPTVAATAHVNVSPAQLAVALTAQTPTVEATAGVNVTPGILELVTALQTPSVATPVGVSPGILEAVLTAFAASVATPTVVTPGIVALITALQTPTVAFTANVNLSPGIIELATTRYTPEADATSGLTLVPGNAALVTAVFAATVAATANQNVSPAQLALVTTMFAATVATPVEVAPGIGTLVTARFAPTVTVPLVLVPGTAALVTARFAPSAVGDIPTVTGYVLILGSNRSWLQVQGSGSDSITIRGQDQ